MTKTTELAKIISEEQSITLANQGELKAVLNSNPPKQWVKAHPFQKNVAYLPIDKVELMLDTIFQEWRTEIKEVKQLAQSIVCTVRLHYKNPISNEWSAQDGVGAVPLKTDKGFTAADLSHIKSDAVQTGAPAAESYALKDAAEHLGRLFGRDLNRRDLAGYTNIYQTPDANEEANIAILEKSKTMEELRQNFMAIKNSEKTKKVIAKKDELKRKFEKGGEET